MALAMSYASGVSQQPLLGETIGQSLDRTAARWPDALALVVRSQSIRLTWAELAARVDDFAAGLLAMGLKPGDRVGIWSPNNAEWVITQLATAKAGLILVTINPAYRITELEYALNKVGCRALVTASAFKTSDYAAMLRQLMPEIDSATPGDLHAARAADLRIVIQIGSTSLPGAFSFEAVSNAATPQSRERLQKLGPVLQFDDAINIQFTSGTTGAPKGATLTHHNILNNGYFIGETMAYTAADRVCIPVPLYHCFGMVIGVLACVTHGSAMVFPGEGFEPLATLQAVAEERCTSLYGVPTMFIAQLDHPQFASFDLTSLRTGVMAGTTCPIELMRRAMAQMNLRDITICYGMTETSPVSLQTTLDDSVERRVTTVGRVHPHLEAKIIDTEGRIVPAGVTGELCTRGYAVMLGYWGDETRTREAIDAAGWMHTGDLATMDAQGYCTIVGRIKDLVIRGGENIYPREVEEFLYRHPAIADVQVFGVPDAKFGEELCAWVRLRDGAELDEDAVRGFCRGEIAHYKIPRHVRFVTEFPMTVTGKMQKFLMRETAISPADALDWLCGTVFPLWLEHGVDWQGGAFQEELCPDTLAPRVDFRRLRVAARQVYAFSEAARHGVPRATDAVALGVAFLRRHARQQDGGYAMRFNLANAPTDHTRDLYDHAFVLLAYAHAGERQEAADLMSFIDVNFRHDVAGYHEAVPRALPRRQNPHMHLLEALLAAAERFADTLYLDRADAIVDLFAGHLFQPAEAALPEFFDDALHPIRHDGRFVVEPGHHHEWVWLLSEHRRIAAGFGRTTRDTTAQAAALMTFAERHGVSPQGIVAGELWSDGAVRNPATRVWPHTERLKAIHRAQPAQTGAALAARPPRPLA
eukprot:gene16070-16242_t